MRTFHSYDRLPPIRAHHVSLARMAYSACGGKNVRGLERALDVCTRRNAPRPVIRVLQELLAIERERERKRMALDWRPMR